MFLRRLFRSGSKTNNNDESSSSDGSLSDHSPTGKKSSKPNQKKVKTDEWNNNQKVVQDASEETKTDAVESPKTFSENNSFSERKHTDQDDPDMVILDCAIPGNLIELPPSTTFTSLLLADAAHCEEKLEDHILITNNNNIEPHESSTQQIKNNEEEIIVQDGIISREDKEKVSESLNNAGEDSFGSEVFYDVSIISEEVFLPNSPPSRNNNLRLNLLKNKSISYPSQASFSPENANFNEWQFWRDTRDLSKIPKNVFATNTQNEYDESSQTVSLSSSRGQGSSLSSRTTSHYYYLIPCTECLKNNFENKEHINPNITRNPSVFYLTESSFCGHQRTFIQTTPEHILEFQRSSSHIIIMGNQPGKGSKNGNKKSSSKESNKRGNSTANLLSSSSGPPQPVGVPTPAKSLKSRPAPPPPILQQNITITKDAQIKSPEAKPPALVDNNGDGTGITNPAMVHLTLVDSESLEIRQLQRSDGDYDEDIYYCLSRNKEPSTDGSDLSEVESLTLADTYRTAASNGVTGTESYHTALGNHDDGDDDTLRNQSDQLSIDSFELTMPTAESIGNLVFDEDDEGKVFAPTSPSSEIIGQRPMTTSFTLTRRRKVELSSVSSPVDELPASSFGGRKDSTVSEQCLAGNENEPIGVGINFVPPRRYASVSDSVDSNVLRKVASLTLAEQQSQANLIKNISKPKFIPEKLDFKLYEKFEGQMLINWFLASFQDGNYLKDLLAASDLKILANQFCTLLLAAGVLKQIEERDSSVPLDLIFRSDLMYYWAHSESPAISTQVPGKLPPVAWPPTKDALSPGRTGAKYTEAGDEITLEEGDGVRTLSPEHLPKPGIVPETVSHFESEHDLTRSDAAEPSKEFQSVVMGLKREHKEILEKKENEHEVNLFSVRGETAQLLQKYARRIEELEQQVETLKTLQEIQNLNQKINLDFASSETEKKEDKGLTCAPPPPPCAPPPPPPPPPPPGSITSHMGPPMPPPYIPPPPPIPGNSFPAPPQGPPPPPMPGGPPPPPMPGMGGPPPPPPPPGMGGGPPPPPPPPGGMGGGPPPPPPMSGPSPFPIPPVIVRAEARKKPVTPSVPMKPLYWTRIQIRPKPPTFVLPSPEVGKLGDKEALEEKEKEAKVWEKIDELPINSWDDFHELFSRQVIEKKVAKPVEVKPVKLQAMKILDSKRSQNVGILVKSLNLEIEQVKQAIFEFDLSVINLETLEKILENKATEDESIMLKSHIESCPDVPLDKPDQFLYDLLSIPNYEERIISLTFQCNYFESLSSIETKLSNLSLVCEQLTSSKELQKVLALILTYGNYMNGGNMARGQADGFTLDILPKLKDVKSKDNNYTFLHFIVKKFIEMESGLMYKENPEEAKLPVPEPSDIERASNTSFDELELELKKLKTDLTVCERRMQVVIDTSDPEHLEPFKSKMSKFVDQAKEKLKEVEEMFNDSKIKFTNTMVYFDFTPKKKESPACEFFSSWTPFCQDFKGIWRNEQQKILKEKLKDAEKVVKQKRSLLKNIIIKKPRDSGGLKDKLRKKMRDSLSNNNAAE